MNPKHTQVEESNLSWLITYGDLMTLMLTFFVLLYSLSTPDPIKLSMITKSNVNIESKLYSMNQIKHELKEIIEQTNLKDAAEISTDVRGVAVELKGDASFLSGSTIINSKLDQFLDQIIIKLLNNTDDTRSIIIEGHSDNQTISNELKEKYPSNWELSAARASAVVNKIIEKSKKLAKSGKISPKYADGRISGRIMASGYADQWPASISYKDRKRGQISTLIIKEHNKTNKLKKKNRRIKIIYSIN